MPTVRNATTADAEGIGEAHSESWRRGYKGLFPPDTLNAAAERRRQMWTADAFGFTHGTLLVTAEEGRISGFIHFGAAESDTGVAEVYGLYVHPSYWGSGIAQALMDQAVHLLTGGFAQAVLWTHAETGRARTFYRKSGWSETGSKRQETLWDGISYPAVQYGRMLTLS